LKSISLEPFRGTFARSEAFAIDDASATRETMTTIGGADSAICTLFTITWVV
jgi:hypothetical protein